MRIYEIEAPHILSRFLAASRQVYQPQADEVGDIRWRLLEDGESQPLPEAPALVSPKALFFAGQENLFVFDGECFRETLPQPEPFVVFGAPACDLHAIAYQDRFFAEDPYYQARRRQALLVGIDCAKPCEQGFCVSVDAGPGVDPATADLILHPLDARRYLLLVCGERGAAAIADLAPPAADEALLDTRDQRVRACAATFAERPYLARGIRALNNNRVPPSLWQALGVQCLSCSGCTTLCPTCSCYDRRDVVGADGEVEAQRLWDSCLYESFQREASQHNPSAAAGERVRRFWQHKFGAEFVAEFGRAGCVGCGRCEQTCPGVIGVHAVMQRLAEHA